MATNLALPNDIINPLKKVAKELFDHAREHIAAIDSGDRSFDRLVAGVHIDNSLELYLKFYAFKFNIIGCDRMQVPELINRLQNPTMLPELDVFAADLRTFHNLRNGAYHSGASLDDYVLNWGITRIDAFFEAVKLREDAVTPATTGATNGGNP